MAAVDEPLNNTTSIGLGASGTGNIAAFTATNATAAPITATITITPTLAGCLGTPGTYTPLDGAGSNTNTARFYYLAVNIDSSQAYGYPDDVSRGPTISDLTLLFTADPSKRLRHGKTFTGGEKQPLDTPF